MTQFLVTVTMASCEHPSESTGRGKSSAKRRLGPPRGSISLCTNQGLLNHAAEASSSLPCVVAADGRAEGGKSNLYMLTSSRPPRAVTQQKPANEL